MARSANVIVAITKAHGRVYVTPEDVTEAFLTHTTIKVRLDALEILAGVAGMGTVDPSALAYTAWKGNGKK